MSDAKEMKFSLKVMINKERTKVLFAESDSHFVDVLLSFLTLPLGRIVKATEKHSKYGAPSLGCLNALYRSVANLDSSHFWTKGAKQTLLDPTSSLDIYCRRLKLEIINSERSWFHCVECRGSKFWSQSIYYDKASCKICGGTMKRNVAQMLPLDDRGRVFTLDTTTFVITDDLRIVHNATGLVQTLSTLHITGTDNAELMNVTLGLSDVSRLGGCSAELIISLKQLISSPK